MARINKVIELLEQGQPAYSTPAPELTYESGLEASQTWADLLLVEFEHFAFDIKGLTDFMRGLKDGGPTPSGHRTPTVVASLPSNCRTRDEVIYNAWQTRHVLSTGAPRDQPHPRPRPGGGQGLRGDCALLVPQDRPRPGHTGGHARRRRPG